MVAGLSAAQLRLRSVTTLSLPDRLKPAALRDFVASIPTEHRTFLLRAVVLAAAVRFALIIAGYLTAYIIIGRDGVHFDQAILETFKRWDANHYELISEHGYPVGESYEEVIVFLPLFPYTVKVVAWVLGSWFVSALLVSAVASVAAGYFLQGIVWKDTADEAQAGRSLWYFFLFPTAYFLAMPYTEALYMALLLGSFWAARRGNWLLAGILGGFSTAARLQGIILFPALIIEALHQGGWRRPDKETAFLFLVPAGLLFYLFLNHALHDDPLAFVDFERNNWSHQRIWPWQMIEETWLWITDVRPHFARAAIYEFRAAFMILTAVLLLAGARWLRPSYQFFGWATLILFLSVSYQISLPRYVLTIFPIYFVLGRITRNQEVNQALISFSAILMGAFYVFYATRWGF